jgi:hypothetical protein
MIASWSAAMVPSTSRIRSVLVSPRLAMNDDWSSSAALLCSPSSSASVVNASSQ